VAQSATRVSPRLGRAENWVEVRLTAIKKLRPGPSSSSSSSSLSSSSSSDSTAVGLTGGGTGEAVEDEEAVEGKVDVVALVLAAAGCSDIIVESCVE